MKLYNSLTRQLEEFVSITDKQVRMYTCGPTVYDYPHIGNWRTYTTADFLIRTLKFFGYEVKYVMNLTDVGHLSGDNEGDADQGEDRLEKGAKREGKTAWEIAEFYSKDFIEGYSQLNLTKPILFAKAAEHIKEQIELIQKIEEKGFAYKIDDGIYFNVLEYEKAGNKYGELSTLDKIKAGARVEVNPQKRDPRDFALWKFSPSGEKRHMEWESPWGVGFPGWHIECSAMSMKYLGEQFDIHAGGEDIRSTHHPNEIAQSEAATDKKPFVRYWIHGAFLTIEAGRMGKSLGNAYTLQDIAKHGFTPSDLRYFYATGHYRKQLNFTFSALESASLARKKLSAQVARYKGAQERTVLSAEKMEKIKKYQKKFQDGLENDLNIPQALAVLWEVVGSNIPDYDKYDLLTSFDQVMGFNLGHEQIIQQEISADAEKLIELRETMRKEGKFEEADKIRDQLVSLGVNVLDQKL